MSSQLIKDVSAYEVLDSRGNPTLATEITLSDKSSSISYVPAVASTGKYEALEKRDFDKKRYNGRGVLKAVNVVNKEIRDLLVNLNPLDQKNIDFLLCQADGTKNKSNFGANSILGVSLANLMVSAKSQQQPLYQYLNLKSNEFFTADIEPKLPIPMMNILNGGIHADNPIDFQEFMIQPLGFQTIKSSIRCGVEIYHQLKDILKKKKLNTCVGDEGGFGPELSTPEEALDLIIQAIEMSGYKPGVEVFICLDCASSEFFEKGKYLLRGMEKSFSSIELVDYLGSLKSNYPISSIEDGLDEDDWEGWKALTEKLGATTQLVGDDIFVSNSERIKKGIDQNVANSVLVKINQVGTISEALEAVNLSKEHDYKPVISHRSGETEDTSIADICVGTGTGQIKTGAPCRTERVAKYNRLMILEEKFNLRIAGDDELR